MKNSSLWNIVMTVVVVVVVLFLYIGLRMIVMGFIHRKTLSGKAVFAQVLKFFLGSFILVLFLWMFFFGFSCAC